MSYNGIHRANRYTGKYWTDERKAELKRLWLSGMPIEEMADSYGVKPDTILTWCSRRFKFGRRHYGGVIENDPEKAKFMMRNFPHMSNATLAVFLGASARCVHNAAERMELAKTEQCQREIAEYHLRRIREAYGRNE